MNFLSTEAPISLKQMLNFIRHPSFEKEANSAFSRFHIEDDFEKLEKLLQIQFSPVKPIPVIGPGKIHRLKDFVDYSMWKVEMAAKGLRKNQSPRVWFAIRGTTIVFLCMKTHADNYDDGTVSGIAESLISDIFS